jgi:hypothetical protein
LAEKNILGNLKRAYLCTSFAGKGLEGLAHFTHSYRFLPIFTRCDLLTRFRFLQDISGFFRFLQMDCKGCIPLAKRVSAVFKWYFAGIPGLFPSIQFG